MVRLYRSECDGQLVEHLGDAESPDEERLRLQGPKKRKKRVKGKKHERTSDEAAATGSAERSADD